MEIEQTLSDKKIMLASLNCILQLEDVTTLLEFYDRASKKSARPKRDESDIVVLKIAGIILCVTAWETFIEDVLSAKFHERLNMAEEPEAVQSTYNGVAESWLSQKPAKLKSPDLAKWSGTGWKDILKEQFEKDIRELNTPGSEKIRKLSERYLGFDLTAKWEWDTASPGVACKMLDDLIRLRGELVHRGKTLEDLSQKTSRRIIPRSQVEDAMVLVKRLGHAALQTLTPSQNNVFYFHFPDSAVK